MKHLLGLLTGTWLAALAAGAHAAPDGLAPDRMVRSLQLVQDRIANGDHAALPMQRKLLELIDARLRNADPAEFEGEANFRALMIYATSGGNPETIAPLLARLDLEGDRAALGAAVVDYLNGNLAEARAALQPVEPSAFNDELAASIGLVKASIEARDEPASALAMLDRARLLAPGTLVEEAALRRSIVLAAELGETERFFRASSQYARRFIRSPYASQFADAFVDGVLALTPPVETARIEEVVVWMTAEQEKTIYLRLARLSAVEGDADLLAFASSKAAGKEENEKPADPRSKLYSSISSVTSASVEDVYERLKTIDGSELSKRDRALLDAAKTVAAEVLAPAFPPPVRADAHLLPSAPQPAAAPGPAGEEAVDPLIATARSKLEAIDDLLQENSQ